MTTTCTVIQCMSEIIEWFSNLRLREWWHPCRTRIWKCGAPRGCGGCAEMSEPTAALRWPCGCGESGPTEARLPREGLWRRPRRESGSTRTRRTWGRKVSARSQQDYSGNSDKIPLLTPEKDNGLNCTHLLFGSIQPTLFHLDHSFQLRIKDVSKMSFESSEKFSQYLL